MSTERQGRSGLGLEAQRDTVARFVAGSGGEIVAEFVEVETGTKANRPQLKAALARCRAARATLLIAKLDRLARNVHFISGLMESGADFVAADNPHATRLMVHLLAAFAEHERELISQRTKAALAAAKVRGVRLGENGRLLAARHVAQANERALLLGPEITAIQNEGCKTLSAIAARLNAKGTPSPRGYMWHPNSVRRVIKRLNAVNIINKEL